MLQTCECTIWPCTWRWPGRAANIAIFNWYPFDIFSGFNLLFLPKREEILSYERNITAACPEARTGPG